MAQGSPVKIFVVDGYAEMSPANPVVPQSPLSVTGNATVGSLTTVGNTTLNGTLVNTGVITATGGLSLGVSVLSNYDESQSLAGSWTGALIGAQTLTLTRLGNMIYIESLAVFTSVATATFATYSLPLPVGFRPSVTRRAPVALESGAVRPFGTIVFATDGTMTLFTLASSNFVGAATYNIYPFRVAIAV